MTEQSPITLNYVANMERQKTPTQNTMKNKLKVLKQVMMTLWAVRGEVAGKVFDIEALITSDRRTNKARYSAFNVEGSTLAIKASISQTNFSSRTVKK